MYVKFDIFITDLGVYDCVYFHVVLSTRIININHFFLIFCPLHYNVIDEITNFALFL